MSVEALIEKLQQLNPCKEIYIDFSIEIEIHDEEEYVNLCKGEAYPFGSV